MYIYDDIYVDDDYDKVEEKIKIYKDWLVVFIINNTL